MFLFRGFAMRIRTSIAPAVLLLTLAMLSGALAAAPDRIRQRFEFPESYLPKLGAQELPGGSKSWTKADRAEFLRQVDRAYDIAPNLLEGAVLYRKVRVYRAKAPKFFDFVTVVRTHELIVPDWFFTSPAQMTKEQRDTEVVLGSLIHELVHLFEPFGSISYDEKWQALVAPRIKKVRDHFLAKDMSVREAFAAAKPRTEHDPLAQAEGLPSLYSAISLGESLAEAVSTMVVAKHVEIPSDMRAFVNGAILQKAAKTDPAKGLAHQAMTALEKDDGKLAQTLFDQAEKAGADWVGFNSSRGDMWRTRKPTGQVDPLVHSLTNALNAIAHYSRAIEIAGSDGTDVLLKRGRVNLALGTQNSYKEAAEDFSAYLAVYPNDPNALFGRANAYKGFSEWHKALTDLDRLVSRKIETAEIYQRRAEVHLGLNDVGGVLEDASKAIAFEGGANAEIYELRGRALLAGNKFDEAIADFTKAIEIKKDFYTAFYWRGLSYYIPERFEPAIADFEMTVKLRSDIALAHFYLGGARTNLKKWDQAETALSRALELTMTAEQKSWALFWRAEARSGLGRDEEALEDLDSAIAIKPDWIKALSQRGYTLLGLKEYDRAIADYSRAIAIDPKYAAAYYNRGIAYLNKGDNDRAIEDYTQALEINPKHAAAYYNRGLAHRDKGDNDRAIEDYTRALEINPKYATAYNSRAWAYYKLGQFEQGLADANTSISLNPKSAYAYDTRAQIEEALGMSDEAIKDFRQALSLKPDLEMSREGLKRLGAQP